MRCSVQGTCKPTVRPCTPPNTLRGAGTCDTYLQSRLATLAPPCTPLRRGASEGYAWAEELQWGSPGYEDVARRLAADPLDWVLAADCCYIDQVRTRGDADWRTARAVC